MDSLTIQDVFEPYHAGRNRVALCQDKRLPAKTSLTNKRALNALPTNVRLSDHKPQSTTEH
ncbi:hypothetical protein ACVDG5_027550 [Mesorhizobium sp. ORM6]